MALNGVIAPLFCDVILTGLEANHGTRQCRQVILLINTAVGCDYFSPGSRLS